MKRILVTGARGQLGTELVPFLRNKYGADNVVATDIKPSETTRLYEPLDVMDGSKLAQLVDQYKIDTVIHLAAILSAVGEQNPNLLWQVNMQGLHAVLEVAREKGLSVFVPSSIAAFGPQTPHHFTPQLTVERPTTLYGITKVSGELLCDYYYMKYGIDVRGVRFPGIVSHSAMPGGGTTDYAVHIYHEALKTGYYNCYLAQGTRLDMLYIPDALEAVVQLMEANPTWLRYRNAYNITGFSAAPENFAAAIQKHIPEFKIHYVVDPERQKIAESWPDEVDDVTAREDWAWNPKYTMATMTEDMLKKLKK